MKKLRRAINLFKNPQVSKSIQRHNQRQWLKAIDTLGDKWILAKPVQINVARNQHL